MSSINPFVYIYFLEQPLVWFYIFKDICKHTDPYEYANYRWFLLIKVTEHILLKHL